LRPAVLLDERIDVDLQVGEQGDALLKSAEQCDLLLIAGTSLKSKHMMNLVQDIARIVHKAGGAVVLIDIAPINMRKWKSYIDFHLQVDIEQCAERIMAEMDKVGGIRCFFISRMFAGVLTNWLLSTRSVDLQKHGTR
jgi:NAD-dependent SIR2 family protein deacetylase